MASFNELHVTSHGRQHWQPIISTVSAHRDVYSWRLPSILLMVELCISGQAFSIARRSLRAQTMNAFIGRLTWGSSAADTSAWVDQRARRRRRPAVTQVHNYTDFLSLSHHLDKQGHCCVSLYYMLSKPTDQLIIKIPTHACMFSILTVFVSQKTGHVLCLITVTICHRLTVEYLRQATTEFISPDLWPPNSPDLNAVDYEICGCPAGPGV